MRAKLGDLTVEQVFPVEEALRPTRLEVLPKKAEAVVGDKLKLSLKATDQFGGKLSLKGVKIDIDGPAGSDGLQAQYSAGRQCR